MVGLVIATLGKMPNETPAMTRLNRIRNTHLRMTLSSGLVLITVLSCQSAPQSTQQSPTPSPFPSAVSPSPKSQPKSVVDIKPTDWSDEMCQGDRYLPVNGASTAQYSSCQYIKTDSLKAETIVLATNKNSEDVAEAMVAKEFKKVGWKDFNPLTDMSVSACIVYVDKSIACHKAEGSNLTSNNTSKPTAKTTSLNTPGSGTKSNSEAILTATNPSSQINLRATPSANGKRLGYGLVGDRVQVITKTTSEGYTWYKVGFPGSGAEGWIRGDFISIGGTSQQTTTSTTTPSDTSQEFSAKNCDPSYPDICIPLASPDLNCGDIEYTNFRVTGSDPHRFDGRDNDGIGCES